MIALARARAERERAPDRFIVADAANTPSSAEFRHDRLAFRVNVLRPFSFGVTTWRGAARVGATLRLITGDLRGQSFMIAAERAAAPLLPALPPRKPDEPGHSAWRIERDRSASSSRAGGARSRLRRSMSRVRFRRAVGSLFHAPRPLARILPELDETSVTESSNGSSRVRRLRARQ